MSKRGLGKGLDALLGGKDGARAANAARHAEHLPLGKLQAGQFQPRARFADAELNALADSIRQHGVIQPVVARPLAGGQYEIIAGERRCRAAKLAGLKSVPVVVRDLTDQQAQIFALVENLQRADLNPMEQARGIARLIEQTQCTHAAAAEHLGMSRSAVSNLLRLQDLAPAVQKHLAEGKLEMGHARALLSLSPARQESAAREIIARGLTTREAEQLARRAGKKSAAAAQTGAAKDPDTRRLEKDLTNHLSMRVDISHRKNGTGKLTLHYGSLDSLDNLLAALRKKPRGG